MRWFLTALMATVLVLAGSGLAQACGCCGCCRGGAGTACPNCPGGGGACPNCPGHAAALAPYRYWNSGYGCYLYYHPATRQSYYWSEPHRAYYAVVDQASGNLAPAAGADTPPSSPASTTYATQYFSPRTGNGNPKGIAGPYRNERAAP